MCDKSGIDLEEILTDLSNTHATIFALSCCAVFTPAWEVLSTPADEHDFRSVTEAIQGVIANDQKSSRRIASELFNSLRDKQREAVYASLPREQFALRARRIACSALEVCLHPADIPKRLMLSDVCAHFAAELDQLSNSKSSEQRKTRLVSTSSASGPLEALEAERQLSLLTASRADAHSIHTPPIEFQDLMHGAVRKVIRFDERGRK